MPCFAHVEDGGGIGFEDISRVGAFDEVKGMGAEETNGELCTPFFWFVCVNSNFYIVIMKIAQYFGDARVRVGLGVVSGEAVLTVFPVESIEVFALESGGALAEVFGPVPDEFEDFFFGVGGEVPLDEGIVECAGDIAQRVEQGAVHIPYDGAVILDGFHGECALYVRGASRRVWDASKKETARVLAGRAIARRPGRIGARVPDSPGARAYGRTGHSLAEGKYPEKRGE